MAPELKGIKKILVIKFKHIGDVLLAVPAVRALKEAFPESEITVLVNSGTEDMLSGLTFIKDVIVYERKIKNGGFLKRLAYEAKLVLDIRKRGFDLAVDFSGGDRGAICALMSGARIRCGFKKTGRGMFLRDLCFTHHVLPDHSKHTVDFDIDLVKALSIEAENKNLQIAIPEPDISFVQKALEKEGLGSNVKFVVIHPASRWFFKCWNKEGFSAVADHIVSKYGISVVFTSSPDKKEKEMVQEIIFLMGKRAFDLSGRLTLKQLAALIKSAVLFIGIDSAPMHMAQAVSTPVIVLFGPSGVNNWGPRGKSDSVIYRDWGCVPCGKDGCNGTKKSRCLDDITAEEVIKVVDQFFKNRSLPLDGGGLGRG